MKREPISDAHLYSEYERMKRDFLARFPMATPEQYAAACQDFARELGL